LTNHFTTYLTDFDSYSSKVETNQAFFLDERVCISFLGFRAPRLHTVSSLDDIPVNLATKNRTRGRSTLHQREQIFPLISLFQVLLSRAVHDCAQGRVLSTWPRSIYLAMFYVAPGAVCMCAHGQFDQCGRVPTYFITNRLRMILLFLRLLLHLRPVRLLCPRPSTARAYDYDSRLSS
jgi:hypothetical protein